MKYETHQQFAEEENNYNETSTAQSVCTYLDELLGL